MIKKIIAGLCLILPVTLLAQERNASPYSYYGIGDMKFKGTAENRSMGGLSIIPDSTHINLQNPASYSSLIFTTFTIGGTTSNTTFKTDAAESGASRTTLDFIAIGLPLKKLGIAVGLMPFSDVGYKIQNTVTEDGLEKVRRFQGSGGINRVFASASYKITPKLNAGVDLQYNFGTIETKSIVALPGVPIQYPTREINESEYKGMSFNLGLMYQTKLNNKYDWYTSATFTPQATLSGATNRQFATISYSSNGNEVVVDEININVADDEVKLPSKFTLGTGFGMKTKWFAGAEYTYQQSNELGNRFDNITNAGFEASHKMSLGGYITPKYQSYNNYFARITYRAGLKYEKTGLVLNNENINDYGISLGLGLPVNYILSVPSSSINLGVEMGRRGSTKSGLIQENYTNFFVSLSLGDRWFVKRRYD